MRAAKLTPTGFAIIDAADPTPAPHQILIKNHACGICSGDVFVYRNRATMAATHPHLGHEASGEIIALGSQVTGWHIGDRVTALASPAYQDYFTADPADLVRLPDTIPYQFAVGEALACCIHAADRFTFKPGARVALIGAGFMGLIPMQIARNRGAREIIAFDPLPDRRQLAAKLGADQTADPTAHTASDLLKTFGTFDLVIEAAGNQAAIDLATTLAAQHGMINLIGYHQSNQGLRTVNMEQWNFKALDIINGHVRREDEKRTAMSKAIDLLATGQITTEPLITPIPFSEIQPTFAKLDQTQPGLSKAALMF